MPRGKCAGASRFVELTNDSPNRAHKEWTRKVKDGPTVVTLAKRLDCSSVSVYRIMKRFPEWEKELRQAQATMRLSVI